MATVIQVLALPKYQLEWVTQHLGHNLAVHKRHYRQQSDSVELAKLSKLMYIIDNNKVHNVVGEDLDSMDAFLSKEQIFKNVAVEDYEDTDEPVLDDLVSEDEDDEPTVTNNIATFAKRLPTYKESMK